MPVALLFHNIGPNLIWAKFCPYNQMHFLSFVVIVDFQWNMLQDSINIDKFCCNPVVLKKIGKTSTKVAFLGPICTTKGSAWTMPKMKKQIFFGRNNKSRSFAFRNFLFYQNIICFGWVISLFLFVWCFLSKKNHFQLKQLSSNICLPLLSAFFPLNIFKYTLWKAH